MIRAVFDTNILVSARLSLTGNPARCLGLAQLRQIESITCAAILDEFTEKLISKFDYESLHAIEAAEQIRKISRLVELGSMPRVVPDDPDDDTIIQCALVGGASHIVSGDKHLLVLKSHKDILIVRPAEFLSLVAAANFD